MLGLVTPEEQQGKNPNDGKLQPSAEQMRLFRVLIASASGKSLWRQSLLQTFTHVRNPSLFLSYIRRTLNGGRFTLVSTSQMMTLHHTSDGVT
uniref:Uncharacterized protein n=1 Tax=Magallana gigas TaxID=29159 RepID=A0A8W8KZI3_MAGGI